MYQSVLDEILAVQSVLPEQIMFLQPQVERVSQTIVGQPFLAGGEAPAQEAVAFGSEGAAGGETQPRLTHEALAEVEAVRDPLDAEKDVHRARR